MLRSTLLLCVLFASAPSAPVELRATGPAEPGDEVTLEVSGLTVPARPEAGLFLFGRLATPARSVRALLLRSTDGGVHWRESLPLVEDSEVLFVDFTGCEGRALVGWSTEGPGALALYASTDCGATWRRRSTLPKKVHSEWPVHLAWEDGQRGTVWLRDVSVEDSLPPRALTTRNGGRSWRAGRQPLPAPVEQPSGPRLQASGPQGARWLVSWDEDFVQVEHQPQGAAPRPRARLPRRWHVQGERLAPATPSAQ